MYTLFVTGGIGSGKSVFTARLGQHGASIIDLDKISADVLEDPAVQDELVEAFGSDVVMAGTVVRATLARRAFVDTESTALLNSITHPRILPTLSRRIEGGCGCWGTDSRVCVVEFQLIEHAGDTLALADEVLCVSCPTEVRKQNAISRGMSASDFEARDSRQIDDETRKTWCTTLVENMGSLEDLLKAADEWWAAREATGWKPVIG